MIGNPEVSVNIVTADRPVVVDVDLDGRPYPMELGTGAAFSLISEETDKQTINPVSKLDRYPIPKVEDLFAKLSGGKTFTKLDLSQAYQQLLLDDDSKKYAVINTHKGLYQYTRLPYAAPGIFQRTMENLLKGIPGVVVYLDDI